MPNTADTANYLQKINDEITKLTANFSQLIIGIDTQASSLVKKMGQSRDYAAGLQQSLSLAVPEIQQISQSGDNFADALKKAADAQMAVTDALKTNILLTSDQIVKIAMVSEAYDIQGAKLTDIIEGVVTAGESLNTFPKTMELTANYARSMGTNVSSVMEMVQKNISEVNKFGFKDGVEGLGRMAARAAQMRISMDSIFRMADDVFNPEGAINMVAAFQRLGVATGDLADPFRLMYLAREDTEEFGKQVTKLTQNFTYFDEKTKTFKLFPNAKADLRDLADATRIPYEDLVKMSQSAERLKIIGKDIRLGNIDDETKQLIASVAQYDKNKGGFTVKLTQDGETKLISQINSDDITKLKEANRELSPKEIAQASMETTKKIAADVASIRALMMVPAAGARVVSSAQEILRGTTRAASGLAFSMATPKEIQMGIDKTVEGSLNEINNLLTGRSGLTDITKGLKEYGSQFVDGLGNLSKKIRDFEFKSEIKKEITPNNRLFDVANVTEAQLRKATQSLGESFGIDTRGLTANQVVTQNTNVKVEDIKVDVSGDVKVLGKNNESLVISPELKMYVEDIVKKTLEKQQSGQMNAKSNATVR